MPFKSQSQRAFLYANNPKVASEFEAHTPKGKKLPNHLSKIAKKRKGGFKGYDQENSNAQFSSPQTREFSPGERGTDTTGVYD